MGEGGGVSVHLIKQWYTEVDLFELKSDLCVICLILIYNLRYFIIAINVVLFYA